MSTFEKFEDILCWQRARELTRQVYYVSGKGNFGRDFSLRNQIRSASVSVMSNIAEGYDRGGTAEFVQFLAVAKASAAEVRSQLYVALDQKYVEDEVFKELSALAAETARMVAGLINYLRQSGLRGSKFKPETNLELETGN